MKESTKTKLMASWRVVVAIGMVSITFIAILAGYIYYKEEIEQRDTVWTEESKYSDKYLFEHTYSSVRLKDIETGEYFTAPLTKIHTDNLKDSITVFFQNNKRGFMNIYTGKIVVEAKFDRAWVFSEGVGAVVMDGKVGFVDEKGEFMIPCQFAYLRDYKNEVDYLFKGGLCTAIGDNGKHGLIDKSGKWVLGAQYDYINRPVNGYRIVNNGNNYGVLDSALNLIVPIEMDWIRFNAEGILLTAAGEQKQVAYDGKTVLNPFVVDSMIELWYSNGKLDDEGNNKYSLSDYCAYKTFVGCGLFDTKNNRQITKAIYNDISAINNNLFECKFASAVGDGAVLINSKGEQITK